METGQAVGEMLQACPELEAPLQRFMAQAVRLRREVPRLDDLEEQLQAAERVLMQETLTALVRARGRQAEAQALAAAQTKRHRQKSS
jgi:hypothetical protein